jgi:hypothetical protein
MTSSILSWKDYPKNVDYDPTTVNIHKYHEEFHQKLKSGDLVEGGEIDGTETLPAIVLPIVNDSDLRTEDEGIAYYSDCQNHDLIVFRSTANGIRVAGGSYRITHGNTSIPCKLSCNCTHTNVTRDLETCHRRLCIKMFIYVGL